jgi:hypothetical protein
MIYEEPFRAGVSSTRGAGERAAGLAMLAAETRRSRRSGDLRSVVSGGSRGSPEAGPRRGGHLALITRRPAWCVCAFRLLPRTRKLRTPSRTLPFDHAGWMANTVRRDRIGSGYRRLFWDQENVERVSEPSRSGAKHGSRGKSWTGKLARVRQIQTYARAGYGQAWRRSEDHRFDSTQAFGAPSEERK